MRLTTSSTLWVDWVLAEAFVVVLVTMTTRTMTTRMRDAMVVAVIVITAITDMRNKDGAVGLSAR